MSTVLWMLLMVCALAGIFATCVVIVVTVVRGLERLLGRREPTPAD